MRINKFIWISASFILLILITGLVIANPLKDKTVKDKIIKSTYDSKDKKLIIEMEKDNKPLTINDIDNIIKEEKKKNKDKTINSYSIGGTY